MVVRPTVLLKNGNTNMVFTAVTDVTFSLVINSVKLARFACNVKPSCYIIEILEYSTSFQFQLSKSIFINLRF